MTIRRFVIDWTQEEYDEYVIEAGGNAEQSAILVKLVTVLEDYKYPDVVQAFGLYMFLEGLAKGINMERAQSGGMGGVIH